jgi:amidase
MLTALAKKEISSSELTEMHIERIELHDRALNVIPVRTFDRARTEAKSADE